MPDSAPLSPAKLMPKVEELRVTTGAVRRPRARSMRRGGSIPTSRVAMREIDLDRHPAKEPPLRVYDTSGPYSDPAATTDIADGPAPSCASRGSSARGDVEVYQGRDVRPEDNGLRSGEASAVPLFDRGARQVLRAKAGAAPTQLAYARRGHRHPGDGICRDPRESRPRAALTRRRRRRRIVRRLDPGSCDAGIRARRDRPRPRDHPQQHQPPGNRADDHRPQFPGQGQRQYRQLDRHLLGRRGSRQAGVGDPLGRRHGHGPVDRAQHPHHPRMDHPQLAGADRHRADLSGAGKGRRQGRGADLGIVPRHA